MLTGLRVYLYLAVLAGLFASPLVGLGTLVPTLFLLMDALLIAGCSIFVLRSGRSRAGLRAGRVMRVAAVSLALVAAYGLLSTAQQGGSVGDAAKYVGALSRAVLVLLAILALALSTRAPKAANVHRVLRRDFILLAGFQISVATLQLLLPSVGGNFIGEFAEGQSARAAFEEGDVSGTFANSIEFAYFLFAAYAALTLGSWRRDRSPGLVMTVLFGFFIWASGSAAATVCFLVYSGFLICRTWRTGTRRFVGTALGTGACVLAYLNAGLLAELVLGKIDNMMLSRLGLLFVSVPALLEREPVRILTGFGLDFEGILAVLRSLPEVPLVFTYEGSAVVINDVFWAALLLGFGAPAMAFALWRLGGLFSAFLGADAGDAERRNLFRILIFICLMAGMLNQILVVRPFAVGLVLGMAPLALSAALLRRGSPRPARQARLAGASPLVQVSDAPAR